METFFQPGGALPPDARDPETHSLVDPLAEREVERERWTLSAASWRAREMAEAVFGGEVEARLRRGGGAGGFRGLLTLTVPFRDLDDHRARESLFAACAGRDPVLGRVPLVFVFEPDPVAAR